MKQKINLRLVGIAFIAMVITMVCMTGIYYQLFKWQVHQDLKTDANILKNTVAFSRDDTNGLSVEIEGLRITWIDKDGTVLYDSIADEESMENHLDRPEIIAALERGEGKSMRNSDTINLNSFYYAICLENDTILRVAMEARSPFSIVFSVLPVMMFILVVVIILCVVLADYLTRQLIRPIETMANNLEDIGNEKVYKELVPFLNTIRAQHENILLAAKSRQDFTANVSHELKTPLTAISGYAELIENHMVGPEQETHFAKEIQKNSSRLLSLINDIINLSELDRTEAAVTYENLDFYELVKDCMDSLSVNAAKSEIKLHFSGEPVMLRCNRGMMCELVENLCQNAIRYNRPGGDVWVEVSSNSKGVLFMVKDNGIGIPKEHHEQIFERFYRVDKSRSRETGGTGLGLAIVKHIVALHDGEISLESEDGQGTKICVQF